MIVLAALIARLRGWKPAGQFRLGGAGVLINVLALIYGVGAIADMVWPRTPDAPWYLNYAMGLTWVAIAGIGYISMVLARPYDSGTAPAGDAWKLAKV
jgi:hypothetical protein